MNQVYLIQSANEWAIYAKDDNRRVFCVRGTFSPREPRTLLFLTDLCGGKFVSVSYKVERLSETDLRISEKLNKI